MYKGGSIRTDENGKFIGRNNTGRADANFLNALNVKWTLNTQPQLIEFYKNPDKKINGFSLSLNDAINRSNLTLNQTRQLLARAIQARMSDALTHQIRNHDVHGGHGYIYALTKWLHDHYVQSLFPNPEPTGNKKHMINVFYNEFINIYELNEPQQPLTAAAAATARVAADKFLSLINGGKNKYKKTKRKKKRRKNKKSRRRNTIAK